MKWEYFDLLVEHGLKRDKFYGKWIIRFEDTEVVTDSLSEIMDNSGSDGWEVINVVPESTTIIKDLTVVKTYRIFYKRPSTK